MTYRTETNVDARPVDSRTVDPRISPALFLRADSLGEATQSASPEPAESSATRNGPVNGQGSANVDASILDAFLGYAESRLADADRAPTTPRYDGPATAAYRHLRDRGFTHDEVRELRFGLFTSPQDVHDWLRRMGFTEFAIRVSGLVFDADGRPRQDWTGNVVVPIERRRGETIDLFVFDPANPADASFLFGPQATEIAAYGLHKARFGTTNGERLVLVENVVDALYLRRRGLPNVAATGCPPARFTPQRWRNLVDEGVTSVTLAFERDTGRASRIHDVLAQALVARVAPEVFVVEGAAYRGTHSAAAFVQRFGCDAARSAFHSAAHAFNSKDYAPGDIAREPRYESRYESRPEPRPEVRPEPQRRPTFEPRYLVNGSATSERYRSFLAGEVEKIAHPAERTAWQTFLADIDAALHRGEFTRARQLADTWYARLRPAPTTEPMSPEPMRPESKRPESRFETRPGTTIEQAIATIRRESTRNRHTFENLAAADFEVGTSFETIEVAGRTARLAMFCDRLDRAITGQPDGCHVVVKGEFTTREIVLGLVARMVRGMSDGPGIDMEEVWSRLSGNDPRGGYADRPWLVDEAVDRLLQSAARIRFVAADTAGESIFKSLGETIERQRGERPVATILGDDGLTADEARQLASRFECPVAIVREPALRETVERPLPRETAAYVRSSVYRYEPEWSNWHPTNDAPAATFHAVPMQAGFHGVLRDWITFEEQRRA